MPYVPGAITNACPQPPAPWRYRFKAYARLRDLGYAPDECSRVLDRAMERGSALTAPRLCPSLWVTTDRTGMLYRIQENDSGKDR